MENLLDGWGITLATFSPLVGVAIMMVIPGGREHQHKMVALVTSLWVAFIGVLLLIGFDMGHTAQLQFAVDKPWIDVISSRYLVGIDGMSLPLILLTMLIVPLCIIYSWDHFPEPVNPKAFLILILILETGMIGTFVAQDLVLFFVFFEVVLLPMFFMIAVWGGEDRRYASLKFFLYTLFGSALMLVSFLALFFLTGADTFSFAGLADAVAAGGVSRTAQLWIFGGMFLGFAIKVPMFPFHTWLPDAHTQAPTVGSVILAA
ncbi:MAG: NADH-quinone oxidoreductase subunit M, partial [Acidimicrobiaceae bacterium]|nr:NADH-quinone oxidoreductase subunit M [Acidimicrobiaceae bacterium]